MMDFKAFQIRLSSPSAFSSSDVIEGSIVFWRPSRVKALKLNFKGHANVSLEFKQVRPVGRSLKVSKYVQKSHKVLLDTQVDLIGEDRSEPVRHKVPFWFRLPGDLPNSFSHNDGDISYFIQAVAIIDSTKYECIKPFDIRNRDHSCSIEHSALVLPVEKRSSPATLIDRIFIDSPPICQILVDKHCYASNEAIKFGVSIQNTSSHTISSIEVYILQVITFKSSSTTKTDEDQFAKIKIENKIESRASQVFANILMQIPSSESKLLASTSCSTLIQVQHYLVLAFKLLKQKQQRALAPICIY